MRAMNYNILKFDILSSTQDHARSIASQAAEGTVIVAKQQTQGRGKPGSRWVSPDGGLYFSLILKPQKDISDLLLITRLTAQVVIALLSSYGIDAQMKLPNDVLVDNKKICGILTEKTKEALIIGVGINVNIIEFLKDLSGTSMKLILNKNIDLDEVLSGFLES